MRHELIAKIQKKRNPKPKTESKKERELWGASHSLTRSRRNSARKRLVGACEVAMSCVRRRRRWPWTACRCSKASIIADWGLILPPSTTHLKNRSNEMNSKASINYEFQHKTLLRSMSRSRSLCSSDWCIAITQPPSARESFQKNRSDGKLCPAMD